MQDMPFVIVEHPLAGIPPEEASSKADTVIAQIIEQATSWNPAIVSKETQKAYPAPTVSVTDNIEDINDLFYRNAWTDGLPIIPPTEERVQKMLSGTDLEPDQLIALMPPKMGAATVQVIAINAVMAGAKPEHLPVIIAAVKAAVQPEVNVNQWLATTHPNWIPMLVQGPIVKELGIACGQSALLPGPKPNAAIGRAFNLVLRLVGGIISPASTVSTMATLGMPNYTFCIGENEDALPEGWNPLRVDSGCRLENSAVSVYTATPFVLQNDHDSTNGQDLLLSTCYRIGGRTNRSGTFPVGGMLILFGPEHAATIARDGFTKEDVKQFIFENAKTPRQWILGSGNWKMDFEKQPAWIKKDVDDGVPMIHQFDNPGQIDISVAGGAGKQSVLGIGNCHTPPVIIRGATLTKAGR